MSNQPAPRVPQQRTPLQEEVAPKVVEVKTYPPINLKRVSAAGNERFRHWPVRGKCPTCDVWGVCDGLKAANAILDEEGVPR